jgi:hypothetical protein
MATITAATAANDAAAAYQRPRGHLAYLGLKAAADELTGLLHEARDGRLSLLDALERLMGTEAAAAESRRLGDPMLAAAALDNRLLHRGVIVGIDGPSYRMRGHQQRADVIRRAVTAAGTSR